MISAKCCDRLGVAKLTGPACAGIDGGLTWDRVVSVATVGVKPGPLGVTGGGVGRTLPPPPPPPQAASAKAMAVGRSAVRTGRR